jgi:uncharacterized protein YbaR (Trm112 family)
MAARIIERKSTNSRLLKNYGSWLYCTNCNKTVAYICYTTYQWIKISFHCSCGSIGALELKEAGAIIAAQIDDNNKLIVINNRYCCPVDDEPLFSFVAKQVTMFEYVLSCLKCKTRYRGILIEQEKT